MHYSEAEHPWDDLATAKTKAVRELVENGWKEEAAEIVLRLIHVAILVWPPAARWNEADKTRIFREVRDVLIQTHPKPKDWEAALPHRFETGRDRDDFLHCVFEDIKQALTSRTMLDPDSDPDAGPSPDPPPLEGASGLGRDLERFCRKVASRYLNPDHRERLEDSGGAREI